MEGSGVFRGWVVLAGAMLVLLMGSGSFFFSYSVFLPAMADDLGWGRGALGAGLSVGLLAFGLPGPIIGASIARFGPRANIILGNLLAAIGLAAMFMVTEPWQLYFFFALIGLGCGFGLFIACTTLIGDWFTYRRSLALGLAIAAGGVGGFIFPPVLAWHIEHTGWQAAWLTLAAVHLVVAVGIGGVLLIRDGPKSDGRVQGSPPPAQTEPDWTGERRLKSRVYETEIDWTLKDAARTRTTWIIAALAAASFFTLGVVSSHQVAYLGDLGYSPVAAAAIFSLAMGFSIVARIVFGIGAARVELRHLAAACGATQVIAFAILLSSESLPLICVYAALFGISQGGLLMAFPTFIGAYYGRAHYAQILGLVFPVAIFAEAVGPLLAGGIFDATGDYQLVFVTLIAVSSIGLVCAVFARPPKLG
jgi:MFS family permease